MGTETNNLACNISKENELYNYLSMKAKNHKHFKFYTEREEKITSILSYKSLFLSNGTRWNDTEDRSRFNPDGSDDVRFGLCMSYMASESVAMWLLYGKQEGFMVDILPRVITDCLKRTEVECGLFEDGKFNKLYTIPDPKIELIDIVYYGDSKDDSKYHIKRSEEVAECDKCVVDNIQSYKKTYPWNYESECRLIVTVKRTEIDERCDTVRVKFDDKYIEEMSKRIYQSPIHKNPPVYCKSALEGYIDWNI